MPCARAQVYVFPEPSHGQHLTIRDRLDLHAAGERIAAARLTPRIGRDAGTPTGTSTGTPSHDFLHLLRQDDAATAWTIVRTGHRLHVWRGASGSDLGWFATLAEALDAALAAPAHPTRTPAARHPAPLAHTALAPTA